MSDHFEEAMRAAVDPISQELTVIEERIGEAEAELTTLKALRTRGQKLLAVLDPEAAKPKPKRDSNNWTISDVQIENILEGIRSMNGHGPFTCQDVSEATGTHVTTIHKGMKILHDRGQVRIDHLGGARNTTKFYALVRESDV